MKYHVPPENQGQIVTVSYAWDDSGLYRKSHDASDGEVVVRRIKDPWKIVKLHPQRSRELTAWDPWLAPPAWLDAAFDAAEEVVNAATDEDEDGCGRGGE